MFNGFNSDDRCPTKGGTLFTGSELDFEIRYCKYRFSNGNGGDAVSRLLSYLQRIRESMDGHKIAIVVVAVQCLFSVLLVSLL